MDRKIVVFLIWLGLYTISSYIAYFLGYAEFTHRFGRGYNPIPENRIISSVFLLSGFLLLFLSALISVLRNRKK